jgi:hypothetical protein
MSGLEVLDNLQKRNLNVEPQKVSALLTKPGALLGLWIQRTHEWGFDEEEAYEAVCTDVEFSTVRVENDVLWCFGSVGVSYWWRESNSEWVSDEDELPE